MENIKLVCDKCNNTNIKVGKISGIAALKSLNAKTGIGGSEVKVYFCAECGKVLEMFVENPEAIN